MKNAKEIVNITVSHILFLLSSVFSAVLFLVSVLSCFDANFNAYLGVYVIAVSLALTVNMFLAYFSAKKKNKIPNICFYMMLGITASLFAFCAIWTVVCVIALIVPSFTILKSGSDAVMLFYSLPLGAAAAVAFNYFLGIYRAYRLNGFFHSKYKAYFIICYLAVVFAALTGFIAMGSFNLFIAVEAFAFANLLLFYVISLSLNRYNYVASYMYLRSYLDKKKLNDPTKN